MDVDDGLNILTWGLGKFSEVLRGIVDGVNQRGRRLE